MAEESLIQYPRVLTHRSAHPRVRQPQLAELVGLRPEELRVSRRRRAEPQAEVPARVVARVVAREPVPARLESPWRYRGQKPGRRWSSFHPTW